MVEQPAVALKCVRDALHHAHLVVVAQDLRLTYRVDPGRTCLTRETQLANRTSPHQLGVHDENEETLQLALDSSEGLKARRNESDEGSKVSI